MTKLSGLAALKTLTLIWIIAPHLASADVYVDLSKKEEISIVNIEPQGNYSICIREQLIASAPPSNNTKKAQSLPYQAEVMIAAKATALEPALIHAVITVESKHNAKAISRRGAFGLMQLMPSTARRFNVIDKNNPMQNIMAGSQYLRELLDLFNGDLRLSLAAYNAGPTTVKNYQNQIPPYKETILYVPKVLKYYQQYS